MSFIKIATDIWSADRIESVNFTAHVAGAEKSITVKLIDTPDDFYYTGDYADIAYNQLVPAFVLPIGSDALLVRDIEAVSITSNNSVATITLSNGKVYSYTGNDALTAIAFINDLVPNVFLNVGLDASGSPIFVLVRNIDWVNLNATLNGQVGVEVRLRTDGLNANGTQITKQFTGDFASAAYDQITSITGTEDEVAAAA
jgi:hypothetical protein